MIRRRHRQRQDASPFRASRAPMPIWRRARRCRMPRPFPSPTFEDAIEAVRDRRYRSLHHPGGEFADRPHRRHPSSAARFRPAYRGRAFPAHPPSVAGPEGRDAGRHQKRLQPGARRWPSAATILRERKLMAHNWYDTAGSAKHVAELGDKSVAAIASVLAAEFYGLESPEGRCRGRASQRHALSDHVARGRARAQQRQGGDQFRLPGEECARPRSTRRWAASPPMA